MGPQKRDGDLAMANSDRETQPKIKHRILNRWSTSLDPLGHAAFECVYPLSAAEKEHVLDWLALIRKQIERYDQLEVWVNDKGEHISVSSDPELSLLQTK